jgi:hypothetical protein
MEIKVMAREKVFNKEEPVDIEVHNITDMQMSSRKYIH